MQDPFMNFRTKTRKEMYRHPRLSLIKSDKLTFLRHGKVSLGCKNTFYLEKIYLKPFLKIMITIFTHLKSMKSVLFVTIDYHTTQQFNILFKNGIIIRYHVISCSFFFFFFKINHFLYLVHSYLSLTHSSKRFWWKFV